MVICLWAYTDQWENLFFFWWSTNMKWAPINFLWCSHKYYIHLFICVKGYITDDVDEEDGDGDYKDDPAW